MVRLVSLALLLLTCIATVVASNGELSSNRIGTDGLQNYQGAYNLATTGTLSFTEKGAGRPSMSREPLPPAALALWLRAVYPANIGAANPSEINGTDAALWVKRFNVAASVCIVLAVFANLILLTSSYPAAVLGAGLAGASVSSWRFGLNSMYTEPVAALALLLCSLSAVYWVHRPSVWAGLAFGVAMGTLALTKAVGATIFWPALLLVALAVWLHAGNKKQLAVATLGAVLAFGGITGAWMLRNAHYFDDPSIAMRGGRVLYYRMLIDQMPPETYRAAFYVWAPGPVQRFLADQYGFSKADLEKGGAGQWLNRSKSTTFFPTDKKAASAGRPDDASTYVYQLRAEYNKRKREFNAAGVADEGRATASSMQRDALAYIKNNPGAHVAAMAPLAWQAAWLSNLPWWAGPFMTLCLPLAFVVALARRRWDMAAFTVVPLGFYGVYLFASHMLPRYIEPLVPAFFVCLVTTLAIVGQSMAQRRNLAA